MRCPPVPLFSFAFVVLSLTHPLHSVASTVRCITPDGRVIYQDTSCPHDARGALVDDTPNSGFRFAPEKDIRRFDRAPAEAAERRPRATKARVRQKFDATDRKFINTGAHVAEVRRKIGPPDQVVRPAVALGKRSRPDSRQQWIYLPTDDDPQTTTILTVLGGLVLHVERKVTR